MEGKALVLGITGAVALAAGLVLSAIGGGMQMYGKKKTQQNARWFKGAALLATGYAGATVIFPIIRDQFFANRGGAGGPATTDEAIETAEGESGDSTVSAFNFKQRR